MKKIAVITITDLTNYGNQLQNYAVHRVLEGLKLGKCENLRDLYCDSKMSSSKLGAIFKLLSRKLTFLFAFSKKSRLKKRYNFYRFYKNIKYSNKQLFENANIKAIEKYFDYFVFGSDQIWNPEFFSNMKGFLGGFTNSKNKIAYSPSIGVSELTSNQKELFKKHLNNFSSLSCREKSGADIISEITGREVPVLIDPTLMLTASDWEKVESKPKFHKEKKYIFCYFLGKVTEKTKNFINQINATSEMEVIFIKDKKSDYWTCGPKEFVYLIHNASLVLTDSFHACVFSLIFEKPFLVFDREDSYKSMNSRIEGFLDLFSLQNHKYNDSLNEETIFNPNFEGAKQTLILEQEKVKEYLLEAFSK